MGAFCRFNDTGIEGANMTITTEETERLAATYVFGARSIVALALRSLAAERDALRQERDGANALVERMHEQDMLAIKAWQAAHPGSELTWPSSARLSAWCMFEVANVTAERDALQAERNLIDAFKDHSFRAERSALIAERSARIRAEAEFSHMQRRIARQRRALAKLYKRRHDRKAERDALRAENARIKELLKEVGSLAASRAGRVDVLEAENARLREALDFYGDVSKYPAPFTGGMGALWEDCGKIARAALGEKE
jgi:hypothetical protein